MSSTVFRNACGQTGAGGFQNWRKEYSMRLTLRTLLAYLDDRLPPEKAREIGLKIQKSAFATELAERVREVKRRRRVATEQDKVPPVDANLIAEYLDDQLAPDVVARLEQRILASDALLAEVASAHELLGMLRDPVPVESRLRERLLMLDSAGLTTAAPSDQADGNSEAANSAGWTESPATSRGWLRWSSVLVGLGLCAWLASVFTDSRLLKPPAEHAAVPVAAAPDQPPEQAEAPAAAQPEAAAAAIAAGPPGPQDNQVPAAASEPGMAANAPGKQPAEQPDAAAQSVAAAEPALADAAAEQIAEIPVLLQSDNRTLLLANGKTGTWNTLLQIPGGDTITTAPNITNSAPLLKNRWFGVPQPFEMKLRYEGAGWQVRALGGSLLRLSGSQPGLQVLSSRLLVTVDPAMAWNDQQLPVLNLQCGNSPTLLTLQTADTEFAVQVVPAASAVDPLQTEGVAGDIPADPAAVSAALLSTDCDYRVLMTVTRGAIGLKHGDAESLSLPAGVEVEWQVLDGSQLANFRQAASTPATISAWMLEPETEPVPEAARIREQLTKLLEAGSDPREAVLPLVTDRNPQAGLLAVEVLVLTRSAESLLNLFFEDLDETVQRRVIDGLQAIMSSSTAAQRQIQDSLATRLPMAEAVNIQKLLNGVSAAAAAEPETAQQLLAYLGDERLGVRTLAIYRLEQITGDRQNFYPAADASRRRDSIRRWQKWLDRQSGTLIKPELN
ncbi:MAG: hypothetical protein LW816_13655 [Planctomyces sp.]|nr:hypothetical protein [Planctomyces sp.]